MSHFGWNIRPFFIFAHFVLPFKSSPWAGLIYSFSHQPTSSACCITANLMAWKRCQLPAHYSSTGHWCRQFRDNWVVNARKAQVLNTKNGMIRLRKRGKGHRQLLTGLKLISCNPSNLSSWTFHQQMNKTQHSFWRGRRCDQSHSPPDKQLAQCVMLTKLYWFI